MHCMLLFEMLKPGIVFYADPIGAVAALKGCKVLTAYKAQSAVIADALALGAVFAAVFADLGTRRAGSASGADLNAFAAKVAVIAEFVSTGGASLAAILADDLLFAAGLAVLTVITLGDSTFDAKHMGCADLSAVSADTAFLA